ncbi:MAG: HEAT repeat domain-containing protein [Acidimicrobiia bacterium]
MVAGHRGDEATISAAIDDEDAAVRASALGALDRIGVLDDEDVRRALGDPAAEVRRRACELAAVRPGVSLWPTLHDADATVVEVAAWACGEQVEHSDSLDDRIVARLAELTTDADDPLVREAGAAALGAIGDERGLPAVLSACGDKPHVRRRAVLALAPFDGPDVEAAIERALHDRDWQVRQAAEDLRRAAGERPL